MEPPCPFIQRYEVLFFLFSCSHLKPIDKSKIMSKRQQAGKPGEEEGVVAKSKPMMILMSKIEIRSPTLDSGASDSPEILGMQCQSSDRSCTGKLVARDVKDVNKMSLRNRSSTMRES